MSDILLAPDPFKGTGTEDAVAFLTKFGAFAAYKKLDEPQQISTFPLLLRDNASTWHSTQTAFNSFADLKEAFLRRYGLEHNRTWSHVADLFKKTQAPGEHLVDYITSMRRQGKLIQLPDSQVIQAVISGMDPAVRPFILQQDLKTLPELEKAATLIQNSGPPTKDDSGIQSALETIKAEIKTITTDLHEVKGTAVLAYYY